MSQKNVNKFLAGAVTATMVATAVVTPAMAASFTDIGKLSPQVKGEVEKAVELGYFQNADKFNPAASITRGQVALTIARHVSGVAANDVAGLKAYVAEHGLESKVKGFVDVKKGETELYYASLIVKNAGAFTQDNLNAANNITRSQMAKVIATSFDLSLDADNQKEITDIDRVTDKSFIKILASNGVTEPQNGKFNPGANVTRSQMASFLVRAHEVTQAVTDVNVTAVAVVNENTLELSGAGLKGLKASDLTIKDNEAASVNASADGKKATVTFKHNFPNKEEQKLTVKQGEETKEFKFTFEFEAVKSVSLDATTYDDDTKGQILSFKVNGQSTTTDSDFLRQQGFTVKFVAEKPNGDKANIFHESTNESTTGLLNEKNTIGKYNVEVQLIKDGKVVLSNVAVVTIADLESSTQAINTLLFKNTGVTGSTYMSSTTLRITETATLDKIIADAGGKKNVSVAGTEVSIKSSNPSVISVDKQTLTANNVGTADITVSYGGVTKTVTYKVEKAERKITTLSPSETTVKVVTGQKRELNLGAKDQYGDAITIADTGQVYFDAPKNSKGDNLANVSLVNGILNITASNNGTGTIVVKEKNEKGKVLTNISLQVTDQVNTGKNVVEYTVGSDTNSNDLKLGLTNEYQVAKYTTAGAYNGNWGLTSGPADDNYLKVEAVDTDVATVTINGDKFTVEGKKAGSTDIHITNKAGLTVAKFTVKFTSDAYYITKVNFKDVSTVTTTGSDITFSTALDLRADGVVYGIDHNVATVAKTKIDENGWITVDGSTLGHVKLEVLSGHVKLNNATATKVTPVIGSKGQVLVRVTSDGNNANTIATKVINVDVK